MRQGSIAGRIRVGRSFTTAMCAIVVSIVSGGCGGGGGNGDGPFWASYGRDAQHSALSTVGSNAFTRIKWTKVVDQAPSGAAHYGSPVITKANTVIIPIKTGAANGFRFDAVSGANGAAVWSVTTDYILPPHGWVPSCSGTLSPSNRFYYPGAGGTIYFRDKADLAVPPAGGTGQLAFYGISNYTSGTNAAVYNNTVFINTPITCDQMGNIYFGVMVTGTNPSGLSGSFVKIDKTGAGSFIPVSTIASGMTKVAHNCAPALSADGAVVYFGINSAGGSGGSAGYLVALNTATLTVLNKARLIDPKSFADAAIYDESTASPTVGPDGDVYYGVLESPFGSNHDRGWLLHYNASLTTLKTPAAFGWDDTASIVPVSMVPGYSGSSPYLLCIKYNNYKGIGGDGVNKVAIVDPNNPVAEAISHVTCMKEVMTVTGITPDPTLPAVREWCINTAVVDPKTRSVIINCEDGICYRWSMDSNSLVESILLAPPTGEAYTPTLIGPDGTVYAINNSILNAIGK